MLRFSQRSKNDIEVKKFVGGPSKKTETHYRKWIAQMSDDSRCLTVDSLTDQESIGRCGIILDTITAEIHLILARKYWGQGLGTRIAQELVRLSSAKFPDKTLTAKAHPSNEASLSILKKLGMVQVGTVQSGGYDNGFVRFEKSAAN